MDDDAAGNVPGVLSGRDHARKVVHGGVGIGAAHGLDESADDVVVLVTGAVVAHRRHVGGLLDVVNVDEGRRVRVRLPGQDRTGCGLQNGEGLAGVGPGHAHDPLASLIGGSDSSRQTAFIAQGSIDHASDVLRIQRMERQEQGAGQERRDDAERGVLRGGGDERDPPILHAGQEGVLLGPGEAVDLVDEQHRLLPRRQTPSGIGDDGAYILDTCDDR